MDRTRWFEETYLHRGVREIRGFASQRWSRREEEAVPPPGLLETGLRETEGETWLVQVHWELVRSRRVTVPRLDDASSYYF